MQLYTVYYMYPVYLSAALHPNNVDGLWLGGAAYRCLLYLGDLGK